MSASSSSTVPAAKLPPLSYAERARRAGASSASQTAPLARRTAPNGKTRSGDESTSPASSSRNLTPNSSAALTLPGSPPPSSSQTSIEDQQAFPPIPKSPVRPPTSNVWAQRKEQMARAAVQQQGHASVSIQTEGNSQQSPATTTRSSLNGTNYSLPSDDSTTGEHDPFVIRVLPHSQGRANMSSASRTPPSLDDDENWPEMGKGIPSASTSMSGSVADTDKKEGPLKKAEKTKWVPIPPAELQATHDAMIRSTASSRAHSQHRRNNQANSRSRQQSQARPSHSQNQSQNRPQNVVSMNSGSTAAGKKPGEVSSAQSRAESTTHSRTTSVQSSPRISTRGRRLPEEQLSTSSAPSNTGSNEVSKKLPNGGILVPEEQAPIPQPMEIQNQFPAPRTYQDNVSAFAGPVPPLSGPHSQSQTPYSHSPVYFPVPPGIVPPGFGYGSTTSGVGYGAPPPAPSPASGGTAVHQQNFVGFAPYGIPQQFSSGQPPYPYMYQPIPFPYYPVPLPDHQLDVQSQQQSHSQQGDDSRAEQLSPVLPPASSVTRPPPPQESGPLSGYRAIAPVPVSPLLGVSAPSQSVNEILDPTPEMVFGSLGQPGGLKSPSPAPVAPPVKDEQRSKKTPTAFAVGVDGSTTIRLKRTPSGRDDTDELANAVKIIDLTDKGSKWEFGTSSHPDAEPLSEDRGEQDTGSYERDQSVQEQTDLQILQPQPQHMQHYPPTNAPVAFQVGGYNMVPHMHLHVPPIPVPSQSPQNNVQPLPSHVPSLVPLPLNPGFVSPLALSSPGPGPQSSGPLPAAISAFSSGDEFEVRDFGYGFGPLSGSGYIPERMREERHERESFRDVRDNFREPRDFGGQGGGNGYGAGRLRRTSTGGGYGGTYFDGGRGFGGRRGRGQNGPARGFPRGGFGGRGGHGNFQRHQPSLSVSTGPFQQQQTMQQSQSQASPEMSSYFVSPSTTTTQYLVSPYGQYNPGFPQPQPQPQTQPQSQSQPLAHPQAPPVPLPVTALSFPLDPTRLYLLGQLEYYFSVQNLASDLFLRKQMDSKGWIPINIIASFNRIRQLTHDPELVKEVLGISSLVEVRGEHVRLSNQQWVSFVLPGAPMSRVDGDEAGATRAAPGEDAEKENEEEDDVVFILGGEESRPWTGAS